MAADGSAGPVDEDGPIGPVRTDPIAEQGTSTYALAEEALRRGRFADAAALARFTVTEATEAFELYREWAERIPEVLVELGAPREATAEEVARCWASCGLSGLDAADARWQAYVLTIRGVVRLCEREHGETAGSELRRARATWLDVHDRLHGLICEFLDLGSTTLGEAAIGPLWDALLGDFYAARERFRPETTPWRESVDVLLLDALAAVRGHLSGPDREGSAEVVEEPDRWRISIPMCGSGGRTYRTGADGEGPAAGMTAERHDWAWGETGVCLYCVHCCQLQQRQPIEALGLPLRVIEPPRWPRDRDRPVCHWYVYKDPVSVPDSAYEAVGAERLSP